MYDDVALVLEGGGMRGAFTSGVLDTFLDNSLYLPYISAVSAGVTTGISYASRQKGRGKFMNIDALIKYKYISIKYFFTRQHSIMNMDFLFEELGKKICPFDFEAYKKSGTVFKMPIINAKTGKTRWIEEYEDEERLSTYCRATCSLPMLMPPVSIDGVKYYDGGVTDAIPFRKALEDGKKKLVIVLTKPLGYIRKKETLPGLFNYPRIRELVAKRAESYNKDMQDIEQMERDGNALIIRPSGKYDVGRMERDSDKLLSLYNEGIMICREKFEALKEFLLK